MYLPKFIELLYLRFIRHKTVFGLSVLLFSAITVFFPIIYPGEESMQNIVIYYERFVGELQYDNPGFHIWTIIAAGMVISIYLPLSAILLGVNILPIAEKDGKELLFSTPKSLTRDFLENSILLTGLIWLICIPSYFLSIVFLLINGNADSIINLTISFVIGGMLAIFIAFLTGFGCSISFSKKTGYIIGGGYTIIGFFSDMAFRNNKDFEALLELNLFSKTKNTQNAIMGTWNEEFILLALLLSIILIILSILSIHRKDFIEGGYKKTIIDESEITSKKITKKLSAIKLPLEKLIASLGWRFPALRDQLHSMVGIMTVFLIVTIGLTIMQGGTYEGEVKTAATFASIDIPFIDAALFNYELEPTLEGWFTLEFFAWAWMIPFGPFILIIINNIIFRDKKDRIAEITWVLPQSETKIIFNRTVAALIGLITLFFVSFLSYVLIDFTLENNGDLLNAATTYLIFMWGYCVFFITFLSLGLLVPYKHTQKTLLLGFTISILLLLAGFITENFLLLALTPFSYFDYMGIFLGEKVLIDVLPSALVCTVIAILIYIVVLKKVVSARDRLVQ
ncbi:MAG: hypothetical protein JSW11_20595 [Candidatus Heimdallarchaeota archaeon]|nr:MAG: hypothetical protein JSW11_20595 [Candidatus Heimdallarchaeota archaeon]